MAYLALARKYRPQRFDDLVGQGPIVRTLVNALEAGRPTHAYLFSGPRGCGKTTTARLLARALNCVKGPTPLPCGECPQCREIALGSSTDDVLEIDGASNRGIDQIRELRETVKYAPARSRHRVIIIDEAHQISKDGFNALLKTLEEPPPHVVFMLATTEANKIPETILSRCQRFQLRAISAGDILGRLKGIAAGEGLPIEPAALEEVSRAAHGSLRDALSLLDQVVAFAPQGATAENVRQLLGLLPREFVGGFSRALRSGSPAEALRAVQQAVADGVDLGQLAEDLLDRRHRLLLWKAGVRDPGAPDARELEEESAAFSEPRLERDLAVLSRTVVDVRRSESPRVTFELACLELVQDALPVSELLDRLEALEARLRGEPSVRPRPAPAPPPVPPPAPAAVSDPSKPGEDFPSAARRAWDRMLEDVGRRKPSLETFLRAAKLQVEGDRTLRVACAEEFQRLQLASHEPLWADFLRKELGAATVRLVLDGAASGPAPVPSRTPEPAPEDPPEMPQEEEPPAPAQPAVEGDDEDAQAAAKADPGARRLLQKFPGRVRRAPAAGR